MVSQRYSFIALVVAAAFSPLGAVLAQTTGAVFGPSTITSSIQPSATITSFESSATPTSSYSESASASETASQTDGLGYYPTVPGQSYDDPNKLIDETAEDSAGADGSSDTFINIPLGAQIGIISVVVIAGIGGLVASYLWYMRRRKQWELQGRRRSLVPRFSVNARGELKMSRPIIVRQPPVPPTPTAVRSSTNSMANFIPIDLEKGTKGRSEFEVEPKADDSGPKWKNMFSRK